MSHFPKVPVRFIESNAELLKSMAKLSAEEAVDYTTPEDVPTAHMVPTYRTPLDRVNGNEMFRRYPNGQLDVDYARDKVLDALHASKDGIALTGEQEAALSVLFPSVFSFVAPGMHDHVMRVSLRISPEESYIVSNAVAHHLESMFVYKLFKNQ